MTSLARAHLAPPVPVGLVAFVDDEDPDRALFVIPLSELAIPEGLTAAERAIVEAVFQDLPTQEIAERRGKSIHTINNQLAAIYKKLGVSSRHELIQRCGRPREP
jgi:DNA-binding CsgD family transcriptional regulator